MNSLPLPATAAAQDDRRMHIVAPNHVNLGAFSDEEGAPLLNTVGAKKKGGRF